MLRGDIRVINIYKDVLSLLKALSSVAGNREQLDCVRYTEKEER